MAAIKSVLLGDFLDDLDRHEMDLCAFFEHDFHLPQCISCGEYFDPYDGNAHCPVCGAKY